MTEIYVERGSPASGLAMNISAALVSCAVAAGATSAALQLGRRLLRRRG